MNKTSPEPRADKSSPRQAPRKRMPWRSIITVVTLAVALLALAASADVWWNARSMMKQTTQIPSLRKTVDQHGQALTKLHSQYKKAADQAVTKKQLQARLSQLGAGLKGKQADLAAQLSRFGSDTRQAIIQLQKTVAQARAGAQVADVEYLLRVARHQAAIRHDPQAMGAALQGAWQVLSNMHLPAARVLRERIDIVMAELVKMPTDPVGQIAETLAALTIKINHLPIEPARIASGHDAQPEPDAANKHWWQRVGPGISRAFSDLVTVRRVGNDIHPLLPPDQDWFLRRNLALKLEAARVAALQGRVDTYRSSIARARRWLAAYFDPNSSDVNAIIKTLKDLQQRTLRPQLPALAPVFTALSQLRKQAGESGSP